MRLNPAVVSALYSTAVLLGQVYADLVDDALESSSTSVGGSTTSSIVERPTFTVRN